MNTQTLDSTIQELVKNNILPIDQLADDEKITPASRPFTPVNFREENFEEVNQEIILDVIEQFGLQDAGEHHRDGVACGRNYVDYSGASLGIGDVLAYNRNHIHGKPSQFFVHARIMDQYRNPVSQAENT